MFFFSKQRFFFVARGFRHSASFFFGKGLNTLAIGVFFLPRLFFFAQGCYVLFATECCFFNVLAMFFFFARSLRFFVASFFFLRWNLCFFFFCKWFCVLLPRVLCFFLLLVLCYFFMNLVFVSFFLTKGFVSFSRFFF